MFMNPGGPILGIPPDLLLLGLVVGASTVGILWIRRITRNPDGDGSWWRFRR